MSSTNLPATERHDTSPLGLKILTVASLGLNDVEAALMDSFVKLANRTRGGGFVLLGHKIEAATAAHLVFTPLSVTQIDGLMETVTHLRRRKHQMLVSTVPVDAASAVNFADVVLPPLRPIPVMDVLVKCKELLNEQLSNERSMSRLMDENDDTGLATVQAPPLGAAGMLSHTVVPLEIWKDSATAVDLARVIHKARAEAAVYQIGFDATTTVFIDGAQGLFIAQQSVEALLAQLRELNILGVRKSAPEPDFPVSSLENLCWQLAHDVLPARLLPWLTQGDGAFQIVRWPNFGKLRRTTNDMSIAAALSKQRLSPLQLARALRIPQDDVQRFINGCALLGILAPITLAVPPAGQAAPLATPSKNPAPVMPQMPAQIAKKQSLLGLIKNRLGFK